MPRTFVFADEAGCFTFNRNQNVSKYFILCTITLKDCSIANQLLELRRTLAWEGHELGDYFHASTDAQLVRDRVYQTILAHSFTVQATIMEKSKAQPQVVESKPRFYQYAYFYHFKYGVSPIIRANTEALVTTASLGTKKEKKAFKDCIADVMRQTCGRVNYRTDFMPSQAEPCLQVVDYCAWAIQRRWERNDERSYQLIRDRVSYEFDTWERGRTHYY